jgi:crotonobetainyl-CoA:carnitine CoA-transferase CaiB-like acyl-CoA transferase
LTALLVRAKTGEGVAMETSLFDSLGEWMSYAAYYTLGGAAPPRTGANHATIAPYGPVTSGDGKIVYLGLQNEREWRKFCEAVLQRPDFSADLRFASNALRVKHRPALDAAMREVFGKLTAAEIIARLEAAQIANARLNTVQEFVEHPQLKARERWTTVDSPAGPLPALFPPVTIEGVETAMNEIPAVGQHGDAILAELGFSAEIIESWRREKII